MKNNIIRLFLFLGFQINAQELKKAGSFQLPFKPVTGSIDRQGNLYFASKSGVIEKYDQKGNLLFHYSPQTQAEPSLLEAWQGLRVFVYYSAFQQYLFLNRFLTDSERYDLGRFNLDQFNGLVTLSGDNNLWVFDSNSLTLQKIDLQNGEVLLDNSLLLTLGDKNIQPAFIREYQNLLFISDPIQGTLIFDNLGNYIETISIAKVNFFSFSKDDLIFISEDSLVMIDIYKKTKKEVSLADPSYQSVFMENNQIFALKKRTIDIYKFN